MSIDTMVNLILFGSCFVGMVSIRNEAWWKKVLYVFVAVATLKYILSGG